SDLPSRLPGGTHVFARILGRTIPYTGTVRPHITALEPGFARVEMRDRRRVRNHLRSVHAIALANVGELATGLATTMALPADVEGILTALSVEYVKKARGLLTAECRTSPPEVHAPLEHVAVGEVRAAAGDVVAIVRATWRLRPSASSNSAGSAESVNRAR